MHNSKNKMRNAKRRMQQAKWKRKRQKQNTQSKMQYTNCKMQQLTKYNFHGARGRRKEGKNNRTPDEQIHHWSHARTHARTNETKRFPGWGSHKGSGRPTSDVPSPPPPHYNCLFAAHLLPVRTLKLTSVQNSCSFRIFDSNKSFIRRYGAFKKNSL